MRCASAVPCAPVRRPPGGIPARGSAAVGERAAIRHAAIDLGAESGRVVVGSMDGERIALEEVHRFPNTPVRVGRTLHWDALRLWADIEAGLRKAGAAGALASVAVDSWGVD